MDVNQTRRAADYRFLFYSHDGLGLGHLRRNLAIASALTWLSPGSSVLLATGNDEVGQLGHCPGIETLKLPSLQKVQNGEYMARRLPVSQAEIHGIRAALLEAAVQTFRPDVMLIDKHPFGACGELRPALRRFRALGGRSILGIRDILDSRESVLKEWDTHNWWEEVAEAFEALLIYGQRAIFDPTSEYSFTSTLAERTHFCGYVVNSASETCRTPAPPALLDLQGSGRPIVLATAGGGEDGFDLLRAFAVASRGAEWQGVIVSGPMSPGPQHDELEKVAGDAGISFYTFLPHLDAWFSQVDAVVCMSGYNTLAEALARAARVVTVPRAAPRTEQLMRAGIFAGLGLLQMLHPKNLTPQTLAGEIRSALLRPRRRIAETVNTLLDFSGAHGAVTLLLKTARERRLWSFAEDLRDGALLQLTRQASVG